MNLDTIAAYFADHDGRFEVYAAAAELFTDDSEYYEKEGFGCLLRHAQNKAFPQTIKPQAYVVRV